MKLQQTSQQFTAMAGVTSTFPFKPLLSRPHDSNLYGLRLCKPGLFVKSPAQLSSRRSSISAKYSGGRSRGFYRPSPSGSRSKRVTSDEEQEDDEDDEALDVSSLRSDTVRLLDQQQNMVGVVSKNEAIERAEDAELDLVILSPEADPPVVRIMDYNKYKYELQKKKRGQQKKTIASRMDLKELKMGYNIDIHDYAVRLKAALKFLKEGDKVKIIVNLKGRENQFRNNAIELLRRFQNDVGELATEEVKNLRDKNMFVILIPNKAVAQKTQNLEKEKEKPEAKEVSAGV